MKKSQVMIPRKIILLANPYYMYFVSLQMVVTLKEIYISNYKEQLPDKSRDYKSTFFLG